MSSRWRPAENSQLFWRTFHPSSVRGSCCVMDAGLPKPAVSHGPHSPLAAGFTRSQSARPFRRRGSPTGKVVSLTVRAVLVISALPGFTASAVLIPSWRTPRAIDAFTAVLPSPNTSYEKPTRGLKSFQLTTSAAGKVTGAAARYFDGHGVV